MSCLNTVTNTVSGCFRTKITILNESIAGRVTNHTKSIHCEITTDNNISASAKSVQSLNVEYTSIINPLSVKITAFEFKLLSTIVVQNDVVVNYNIVCSPNVDTGYYLYVQEGIFILSDGNKFELIKDEL